MGSERLDDFGELKIKFLTSALVTSSDEEKTGAGWLGKGNGLTSINGRFAPRDLILSVKMNEIDKRKVRLDYQYLMVSYDVKLCQWSSREIVNHNNWQIAKKNKLNWAFFNSVLFRQHWLR